MDLTAAIVLMGQKYPGHRAPVSPEWVIQVFPLKWIGSNGTSLPPQHESPLVFGGHCHLVYRGLFGFFKINIVPFGIRNARFGVWLGPRLGSTAWWLAGRASTAGKYGIQEAPHGIAYDKQKYVFEQRHVKRFNRQPSGLTCLRTWISFYTTP